MQLGEFRAATACITLAGVFGVSSALADDRDPHAWLDRMSNAVQTINYEGTVIRLKNGVSEALKVVHTVRDGVIHEKVIVQEGNGLEIIRNGNEVHCILPDRKSVLVEEWNDQSTLFSTLPSSDIRFGNEYDVAIVRRDRVAGRKAVILAIRPHDGYRYGHRIWLDLETGFPLKTQLIGEGSEAIEQVKFADIDLDSDIQLSALKPSYSIDSFQWYAEPRRAVRRGIQTDWVSDELPRGFTAVSIQEEQLPDTEQAVTHILYSDGLANVSVFIAAADGKKVAKRSRVGGSNSYSLVNGGHRVTAVGEVPAATVEQIARSMRRK